MGDGERDRDRDRERRRDRDRIRVKSSHTPERTRPRHTRSRTRSISRSRTPDDRSHRRRQHHDRSLSTEPRKQQRRESTVEDERDRQKAAVLDLVEGIAKEQKTQQKPSSDGDGGDGMNEDEIEMMKKLGMPTGFDSTKGRPVLGADVSGVRAVTKRQPRQYMNRRGGFNRPLPAERSR